MIARTGSRKEKLPSASDIDVTTSTALPNRMRCAKSVSSSEVKRKVSGFVMNDLADSLPQPNVLPLKNRKKVSLSQLSVASHAESFPTKRRHSFSSTADLPESVYEFLETMPWLRGTPEEFLQQLSLEVHMRPFRKGDIIIRKGDVGRAVFFVVKGTVEVISDDGEVIYAKLTDGSILGEIAILLDTLRTCTVRAGTTCFLLTLNKDVFQSFLQEHQIVKERVMKQAQDRLKNSKIHSRELEGFGKEFALPSISETLMKIPLFEDCDMAFIYELALETELRLYQPGEVISAEGSEGLEMFFLVRGLVEMVSRNGLDSRQILKSGCFFGEMSLLKDVVQTKSFIGVTSCDLLVISKQKLQHVLHSYPHIEEKIQQEAQLNCTKTAIE